MKETVFSNYNQWQGCVYTQKETQNEIVYKIDCCDGSGMMHCYHVFPGIDLMYNDFHSFSCCEPKNNSADIIEINHCRKGRFECRFNNGTYAYIGEGDMTVNRLDMCPVVSEFPLGFYMGVAVVIDRQIAKPFLASYLADIEIDLDALWERLFAGGTCFSIRATEQLEHIFHELYDVDYRVQKGYFKIKVLELLLFLSVVPYENENGSRSYLSKEQADKVKRIKSRLTEDLEHTLTLEQLATEYEIGLTTLKNCFKAVYGTPVYSFLRTYRMQKAAQLLEQTQDTIITVAGKVGYENGSKFAAAFKDIMGISPKEYRKFAVRLE